jgi:hypothetical protein
LENGVKLDNDKHIGFAMFKHQLALGGRGREEIEE